VTPSKRTCGLARMPGLRARFVGAITSCGPPASSGAISSQGWMPHEACSGLGVVHEVAQETAWPRAAGPRRRSPRAHGSSTGPARRGARRGDKVAGSARDGATRSHRSTEHVTAVGSARRLIEDALPRAELAGAAKTRSNEGTGEAMRRHRCSRVSARGSRPRAREDSLSSAHVALSWSPSNARMIACAISRAPARACGAVLRCAGSRRSWESRSTESSTP